jgi:hypothetical protein
MGAKPIHRIFRWQVRRCLPDNNQSMKRVKNLRRFFRLHIDISTVLILAVIFLVFYRPLLNLIFKGMSFASAELHPGEAVREILLKVISEIITISIVFPVLVYFFKINTRALLSGKFTAFDIDTSGSEVEWGTVTLTYNLFSNKIRGSLVPKTAGNEIEIEAVFERSRFLCGYYVDKKTSTRRRLGGFLLMLDGEGSNYTGQYVFVDPQDANDSPKTGKATWKKIK